MMKSNPRRQGWRWCFALLLVWTIAFVARSDAYRVGDVVDTDLVIDSVPSDALRSQMPLFGVRWTAHVRFNVDPAKARTFSLQFEDGLWTLPVTPLVTKGKTISDGQQYLERMTVQFVYSKSGVGAIHSVVGKDAVYSTERRPFFTVEYQWIEEEAVYVTAGHAVMFLAVLVASILFLLISCGVIAEDGAAATSGNSSVHSVSVPKWD
jgi:hypothetical protein